MYVQQILAQISICDLICCLYILFEPVYNILHNKIQIWTFDSDNRIDLLWEFNDKSGRANFVATPATSTYDYSNGMYLPQKEVAAIDLVWPSTSNSALSNLLCFVVSDV